MANGTEGRVYGGDPNLIHIADGMRTIATLAPYEREEYVGAVLRKEHPAFTFTIQQKAA